VSLLIREPEVRSPPGQLFGALLMEQDLQEQGSRGLSGGHDIEPLRRTFINSASLKKVEG